VPKDWEVRLGTFEDEFSLFLTKIPDWEVLLVTLGDALTLLSGARINAFTPG
jgi:hypothetical protein